MRARNIALWTVAAIAACAARTEHVVEPPPHEVESAAPQSVGRSLAKPACAEQSRDPGAWPRAVTQVRVVRGDGARGHLIQAFEGSEAPHHLRFLGAHLFDLLDKLHHEGGPSELDRRRVICAALNAAAMSGAPVIRLWGSLKRTGTSDEVTRAADLLSLVVDENARRARPLRFIVTLLNHQGGYGAPKPERSLDDQDPASPWHSKKLYLEGGYRVEGSGQLSERIRVFKGRDLLARSPEILAWELVNELDTHTWIAGGTLRGPEADKLRDDFLIPLLRDLTSAFSQPIMAGDLRGSDDGYVPFVESLIASLPPDVRARLVWTSHVYAKSFIVHLSPFSLKKLMVDLIIAARFGLPFLLGEIGEHAVPSKTGPCASGKVHDIKRLFASVAEVEAAVFWGEGRCGLPIGDGRTITLGAGGDSADLGPDEQVARDALLGLRASPRFVTK